MSIADLATRVAQGLGIDLPQPLPRVLAKPARPEVTKSEALSLFARPGDGSIRTRRIALLVADGIDATALQLIYDTLTAAGSGRQLRRSSTRFRAIRVRRVASKWRSRWKQRRPWCSTHLYCRAEKPRSTLLEEVTRRWNSSSSNTDIASRFSRLKARVRCSKAPAFDRDYPTAARTRDYWWSRKDDARAETFVKAIARHRHFERQMDPPPVSAWVIISPRYSQRMTTDNVRVLQLAQAASAATGKRLLTQPTAL